MHMSDADSGCVDAGSREESSSDRSLLRRFQRGESDAATLLFLRYAERLGSLAWIQLGGDLTSRFDPDDIVQSVFRTFFRRAAQGLYDVPEGQDLWKLLLVIALQKIRDASSFHRAAKRDVRTTRSGEASDRKIERRPTQNETDLAELRMMLEEILGGLPATQRVIVELRIDGFQIDEIAEKTGRSRRTVERGLQEFRALLGAILHQDT
jgi:RNA polymerase sigma-70 factor, ECF subfamily